MDATVIQPQFWQRWRNSHRLALLAAFEDSTTGTRVREFCQGLSRSLGSHCRLVEHVWLFRTLRLGELREIAAEEACASDLIIISTHQAEGLSAEVKGWIELWLRPEVRHPAVLLALLDPESNEGPSAVQTYLQEVARRGGMQFIAGPPER
jgi:hypothetical protein